jgi:hypothetical protein
MEKSQHSARDALHQRHMLRVLTAQLWMLDCTICLLVVPAAFGYPAAARSVRCLMTSCCMLDSAARFIAAATPGTKVRTGGLDTFPLIKSSFEQLKATNYVFAGCVSPYQQAGGNGLSLRCWALQGLSERCCRPLTAHSTPYLDGTASCMRSETASCMRSGLSARWQCTAWGSTHSGTLCLPRHINGFNVTSERSTSPLRRPIEVTLKLHICHTFITLPVPPSLSEGSFGILLRGQFFCL